MFCGGLQSKMSPSTCEGAVVWPDGLLRLLACFAGGADILYFRTLQDWLFDNEMGEWLAGWLARGD